MKSITKSEFIHSIIIIIHTHSISITISWIKLNPTIQSINHKAASQAVCPLHLQVLIHQSSNSSNPPPHLINSVVSSRPQALSTRAHAQPLKPHLALCPAATFFAVAQSVSPRRHRTHHLAAAIQPVPSSFLLHITASHSLVSVCAARRKHKQKNERKLKEDKEGCCTG